MLIVMVVIHFILHTVGVPTRMSPASWSLSCQIKLCMFRWPRRKRILTLHAVEAMVQLINLVFYLAPNVYVVRNPCDVETTFILVCGFVQWTCWNTVSPWHQHSLTEL